MSLKSTLACGFVLLAFFATGIAAEPQRPPNIVLIISDDQHWDDYSFMGHAHIKTPHLDRFASQSRVYRRGYVPCSLCRPSLATLLTGLYPHQHRITSNDPPLPAGKKGAAAQRDATFLAQRQEMIANIDRVPTVPRLLAKQGYVSFQTGKFWEGDYKRGGFTEGMSVGGRHGDAGLDIGRKTMQPMYDFVRKAKSDGKPFFLWYAPMLPHSPHNPPERLLAKYKDVAPTLAIAQYWACVEWFDETCGDLLKFLDEQQVAQDTLVVYLADNGWLQDPDADRYAPRSKQSPYEGGLRTPIMLRWPGKVEPGERPDLAISLDLIPTMLAAAGASPTKEMPGLNLLEEEAVRSRQILYGECFEHNAVDINDPGSSLRFRWCIEKNLKLIVPNPAREPDAVLEMFDLATDPQEKQNLATQRPDDVQRLREKLDAWYRG